jgi:4a-hydroxytetrahydrobiopterin dehydratase
MSTPPHAAGTPTSADLRASACAPCRGDTPALDDRETTPLLTVVPGWELVRAPGPRRLRRTWKAKSFLAAIEFFAAVAAVAEKEGHHPDLHLVDYRNLTIEISTHAIGGLSTNDFILAAKIDALPPPT